MDLRLLIEAILCDGNVERFLRTDTIDGMWTDLTRPERAELAGAVWNRACETHTHTHTHCTHARIGRERENTAFAHLIFWMRIHDSNRLRIWIGSRQLLDGSSLVYSLFNSGWVQNEIHGFLHGTEPPNATREDHYSRPRLLYLGKYI